MKIPAPDDWDEEADGYCVLFACIPNSSKWRDLYRGLFWQPTWWYFYDKDGPPFVPAREIARIVYEGLCMANCEDIVTQLTRIADALEGQQTNAIRELTAVVGSLNLDLTQPVPDNPDYSGNGLAAKFRTSNWIAPDENLADILANSLFGRYIDPIPNPLTGDGITDILDEQVQELSDRFIMPDSSLFNLFGTKNIVEAMETLLRKDSLLDIEFLPNVATILDRSLNLYIKPEGPLEPGQGGDEALAEQNFKTYLIELARRLKLPEWIISKLETERTNLVHFLMLIAKALENDEGAQRAVGRAILEAQTIVNLNNYNGCCDEEDCDCAGAETKTISTTLEDLDEDIVIDVGANGSGPS